MKMSNITTKWTIAATSADSISAVGVKRNVQPGVNFRITSRRACVGLKAKLEGADFGSILNNSVLIYWPHLY
jgi:hypothetical protein